MNGKTNLKRLFFLGLSFFLCLMPVFQVAHESNNSNSTRTGQNLYSSSYALVIGIEDYDKWPTYNNAIKDAVMVGNELELRGFDVTYRINLKLYDLKRVLEKFFFKTAVDYNSSLFVWFSGRGYNLKGEGFLLPADAPKGSDSKFKENAFPLRRFEELSKLTKAKHVFMVFDSCLSSTIFKEEENKEEEKNKSHDISVAKEFNARQFIYSCINEQSKSDDDKFRERFIEALKVENIADINKDKYLTASEICRFLKKRINNSHYGRLADDQNADKGDFIFSLYSTPGESFHDPLKLSMSGYGPEMIVIPSGTFMMGSENSNSYENEKPKHEVTADSIAVSVFEITFNDYALFCADVKRELPDNEGWEGGDRPVINVSWGDANAYTEWLSEQTGYTYRLPTEAEWEYFARAGADTDYGWGNEIGQNQAACDGCDAKWGWDKERKTAPVGSFAPNPFGIYDTVGNVWEWTCSEYTDTYIGKETNCLDKITNPIQQIVLRGGAWDYRPDECRVYYRISRSYDAINDNIGFRVVRELK